jgi:hypothetical protein
MAVTAAPPRVQPPAPRRPGSGTAYVPPSWRYTVVF